MGISRVISPQSKCQSTRAIGFSFFVSPPPDEELVILYDLVMRGNLKAVTQQVEQLKSLDAKYIPFAERVGELAASFQEKQLRLFINDYKADNKNQIDD